MNLCCFFTSGNDPALLVGPENTGYAREAAAINDIRELIEFASEHEDYPFSKLESLKDIVSSPNRRHILGCTTNRTLKENDTVCITIVPRYEG